MARRWRLAGDAFDGCGGSLVQVTKGRGRVLPLNLSAEHQALYEDRGGRPDRTGSAFSRSEVVRRILSTYVSLLAFCDPRRSLGTELFEAILARLLEAEAWTVPVVEGGSLERILPLEDELRAPLAGLSEAEKLHLLDAVTRSLHVSGGPRPASRPERFQKKTVGGDAKTIVLSLSAEHTAILAERGARTDRGAGLFSQSAVLRRVLDSFGRLILLADPRPLLSPADYSLTVEALACAAPWTFPPSVAPLLELILDRTEARQKMGEDYFRFRRAVSDCSPFGKVHLVDAATRAFVRREPDAVGLRLPSPLG